LMLEAPTTEVGVPQLEQNFGFEYSKTIL